MKTHSYYFNVCWVRCFFTLLMWADGQEEKTG